MHGSHMNQDSLSRARARKARPAGISALKSQMVFVPKSARLDLHLISVAWTWTNHIKDPSVNDLGKLSTSIGWVHLITYLPSGWVNKARTLRLPLK